MPTPLREMPAPAIELIKSFEGIPDGDPSTVKLDAYLDPLDIWTIGWGHAVQHQGRHLKGRENVTLARALYPGGITLAQAEALLRADLLNRSPTLLRMVTVALNEGQFGALMSFLFNCGEGNLRSSTLLRLLNAGDYAGAAEQFAVWNKGRRNGVLVELAGLTRRRRAERALFLGQDWRAASVLVPAARGGPPAARSAPPTGGAARALAPERPVRPSAAAQRAAALAAGSHLPPVKRAAKKKVAKKAAEKTAKKVAKKAVKMIAKSAPRQAPAKRAGA